MSNNRKTLERIFEMKEPFSSYWGKHYVALSFHGNTFDVQIKVTKFHTDRVLLNIKNEFYTKEKIQHAINRICRVLEYANKRKIRIRETVHDNK